MSQITDPSPPGSFITAPLPTTGGFLVVPSQNATEPLRVNGSPGGDLIFLNFLSEEQFVRGIQDAAFEASLGIVPPQDPEALAAFNAALAATDAVATSDPTDVPGAAADAIDALDSAIQVYLANGLDVSELIEARTQIAHALGGQVDGGAGNDSLVGGQGYDLMLGGPGADLIFGNQGEDTIDGGSGDDSIYGGKGNDLAIGGDGNDRISGDLGDDEIFGNKGDDTIFGGQGNDTIFGGQGNDTIFGDAGNDLLFGDRGNDWIFGGEGEDTFRLELFGSIPTAPTAPGNRPLGLDTLADFNSTQDRIQLDRRIFPALNDTLRSVFSQINDPADLGAQTAAIVYDASSGLVYYNPTSAAGDEVDILKLEPKPANLSANNLSSF